MNIKQLFMSVVIIAACLFTALLFLGCSEIAEVGAGIAQATGNISSDQAESIKRGSEAIEKTQQKLTPEQEYYVGRAVAATVFQTYQPLDRTQQNEYLNLLGQSLAMFSDFPETFGGYHFLLLDSEEINAFAAPSGFILVTRGMLRCCNNEDELAAVLAHEICHVSLKHGINAIQQGRMTEALTILASESAKQFGNEELQTLTRNFEGSVSDIVKTLMTSGYSREQEYDADAGAVKILQQAGYPQAAILTMLQRMDDRLSHSGGLGFAKTHPSPKNRADAIRNIITDDSFVPNPARQERFTNIMQPLLALN